jgi:O-antigen ligase
MAERAVWRPPWYLWAALGCALLLAVHAGLPWLFQGYWLFVVAVALAALTLLAAALWQLPPATMMCAAIALTIFSSSWRNMGLPGFPFVPDRILLIGVLLALLLRAPGTARLPKLRVTGVHLLLALTVAYASASAAAAGTLGTNAGAFGLLDQLGVIPFVMLLVAPVLFCGARERSMLLATLVGVGGYLGLTALFEALGPSSLVFPRYIVTSDALSNLGQAGGPFRSPVSEGFACFACGTAAVIAFSQWRGAARCLAGIVIALCALGTFFSLERGVWIAAVAGASAAALAAPRLRRGLLPAAAVCGLLIAGALSASPTLAAHATARAGDPLSVWDRQNQTAAALRMIAAKPLFGFGWGNYANTSTDYFRQANDYPMSGVSIPSDPLPLHDGYLSYAVELGLVGGLLWLGCLLAGIGGPAFRAGAAELRPWRLGLIAIAVFFCVVEFFNPLQQNFTQLLLWTWAGIVVVGVAPRASRASASSNGSGPPASGQALGSAASARSQNPSRA